jgi:hypothetical protein
MVIKDNWAHVYQNVKDQCTFVAKGLIPSSRFDECYKHHLPLILVTTKSFFNVP